MFKNAIDFTSVNVSITFYRIKNNYNFEGKTLRSMLASISTGERGMHQINARDYLSRD